MLNLEITPKTAANILRVSTMTISRWMANKTIREFKRYGVRKVRIPRTEIDRILRTPGRTALVTRLYDLIAEAIDEVILTGDGESIQDLQHALQYARDAYFAPYDTWGRNIDGMRYHLVTPRLKHPGIACLCEATGLLCAA